MNDDKKAVDFFAEHLLHFASLGALFGAYYFTVYSNDTSVFGAVFTPILFVIVTPLIAGLLLLFFLIFDLKLDTDKKKWWGTGIILAISITICVIHVLRGA